MRSPIRRRHAVLAALSAGILITAGCGGNVSSEQTSNAKELFLQPVADRGPDPFTQSTAVAAPSAPAVPSGLPSAPPSAPPSATSVANSGEVRAVRTLPGSTPGLYGGIRSVSSCDVERQVRLLTEDRGRAGAFARGAGISRAAVPEFLRGLTPVVLRADTRMTNHGYRGGSAVAFQSVLQAGTSVMVDDHGMPRVRCACGNPLRPAVASREGVVHKGERWSGYRADRVVLIDREPQAVANLIIADTFNRSWIERKTGTRGDEDAQPGVLPPYGPDADITDPEAVTPPGPLVPDGTPRPDAPDPSPPSDAPRPDVPDPSPPSEAPRPDVPDEPDATTMAPERDPAASLDCPVADPAPDVPAVREEPDGSPPAPSGCGGSPEPLADPLGDPLADPLEEPLAPEVDAHAPVDGSDLPFESGQEPSRPDDSGARLVSPDDGPLPPLPEGPRSAVGPAGNRTFSR